MGTGSSDLSTGAPALMRTRCPRRSPLLVAWHAKALSDGFRDFMVLALRDHGLERARSSRL